MDGGGLRAIAKGDFAPITQQPDMGPAPMLQWLPVADLVVDDRYQRPIYGAGRTNVRRIAEQFRWSKFAPVIVAPIAGGKFAIIDGQHRTTAAHLIGVETVPCLVIIADLQEQAAAFKAVNGQVTRMHKLALQSAAVAAGDAGARELQEVAEAAGVTILSYPKMLDSMQPGETMALGAIEEGLRTYGRDTVITALMCVTETSNNEPGALAAQIVKALCATIGGNNGWREAGERLFRAFDDIDLQSELEEAKVTRRPKGVATWEVLAERLKGLLMPQLGAAG
jgi:hypothetical protein